MKAISKYFAMCAIALLGLANTSCMSDDIESTAACDYSVVLEYKVGGSATETRAAVTRAAVEDGSEDLNENLINRLDLFVFKPDGSRVKQVTFNSADVKGSSPTTEYRHKELTSNDLTRSDIDGNVLYLVANLDNWGNINNLADLQKATINQATTFQYNQKQSAFVMDAKMLKREVVTGKIHLKFQLKRALAKIRLNVQDDKGNIVDPTKYACQLIHYAADGAILVEGNITDNALNTDAAASSKVTAPAVTQDKRLCSTHTQTVGLTRQRIRMQKSQSMLKSRPTSCSRQNTTARITSTKCRLTSASTKTTMPQQQIGSNTSLSIASTATPSTT